MAKKIDVNIILPYVLVGGAIFAGYKLLQKLGLIKTASEAAASNAASVLQTANFFAQDYYKTGGAGTLILTNAAADFLAKSVYDSKGYFNDDEDKLFGVFKSLKTKSQVSYLADIFYQKYRRDMITYIRSFLNDNEMLTLKNIVDKLPNYKVK